MSLPNSDFVSKKFNYRSGQYGLRQTTGYFLSAKGDNQLHHGLKQYHHIIMDYSQESCGCEYLLSYYTYATQNVWVYDAVCSSFSPFQFIIFFLKNQTWTLIEQKENYVLL